MGDELKNKILERHRIKIAAAPQMVSRICGRCSYVNKLESKYCEGKGCNYPLTQLALDEIKAAEEAKFQALRNELVETKAAQHKKDSEMQMLKEHMAKMEESQLKITELLEVMKIAKFSDGKIGKDTTMLDEKRRVTIGYVDDNNRSVEMKVPLDGFEIDEASVDVATSHPPKRGARK